MAEEMSINIKIPRYQIKEINRYCENGLMVKRNVFLKELFDYVYRNCKKKNVKGRKVLQN